ncbi:MAG TPA: DUF2332 domain-containing protein [Dehalococcoidia bacterium]|nr:DUF2332 domain-containing protein [Dehalococcoidia bacterium]
MVNETTGRTPAELARRFRLFAEHECHGRSPLYERLSYAIAEDGELLRLAAEARQGQPVPNLLFGAVHFLLLRGEGPELARFFRTLGGTDRLDDEPFPVFRAFCLAQWREIAAIVRARLVQTAHARRCALLLPAFELASRAFEHRPLALIEVGASAGLNLVWDRYGYAYADGRRAGGEAAPLQLTCDLRGPLAPPLPERLPAVGWRIGLDLNPIDLADQDEARWLAALIWPDEPGRAQLLREAIAALAVDPPRLVPGDALETLPAVLADVPSGLSLCMYHSFTLNQFSPEGRQRFANLVGAAAQQRELALISLEALSRASPVPELTLSLGPGLAPRLLARCDAHGAWIEWLDPATAANGIVTP